MINLVSVKGTYFGLHQNNKSHIVAFQNLHSAQTCITYLSTYKSKYGKYPPRCSAAYIPDSPLTKPLEIKDELEIIETSIDDIDYKFSVNNIGILLCKKFTFTENEKGSCFNMTSSVLPIYTFDISVYKNELENLLN